MAQLAQGFGTFQFFSDEISNLKSDDSRISHIELLEAIEELQEQCESKDCWDYLEMIRLEVIKTEITMHEVQEAEMTVEDFVSMKPAPMFWESISQLLKMPMEYFTRLIGASMAGSEMAGGKAYAFHLNGTFQSEEQRIAVKEFIGLLKSTIDDGRESQKKD